MINLKDMVRNKICISDNDYETRSEIFGEMFRIESMENISISLWKVTDTIFKLIVSNSKTKIEFEIPNINLVENVDSYLQGIRKGILGCMLSDYHFFMTAKISESDKNEGCMERWKSILNNERLESDVNSIVSGPSVVE